MVRSPSDCNCSPPPADGNNSAGRPFDGLRVFWNSPRELSRNCQQHFVEFGQVGIDSVVARAPFGSSLFRAETQNREVVCRLDSVHQLWELLADISCGMLADDSITLLDRQNGAQHTLVFCVGLAKIKVWHT